MSEREKRSAPRIRFDHAQPAQMMAIDGTWRRGYTLDDVSEGGAKVSVGDFITGCS